MNLNSKLWLALFVFFHCATHAEVIGSVDTAFNLVGADDKVVIEVFDDPMVKGVSCYLAMSETGGITAAVNLARDSTNIILDCQQTGPIALRDDIRAGKRDNEEVFEKTGAMVFKVMQVRRFYDPKRNSLVYLGYGNIAADGSISQALSVVPIRYLP